MAKGLGKRYRISGARTGPSTLRESLTTAPSRTLSAIGLRASTDQDFWALRGVDMEIREGEVVGVVGRNGAGKSTLLKILSRITEPTEGRAGLRGRVGSLLEVGTGFHPELTGRENVFLNGAILGMSRTDIRRRFDEIIDFAGIEQFLDTPVKRYSSGMYVRLAFAVAAHLEPDVLLIDEVLAVGDVAFQQKCLGRMSHIARGGRTVVFVSHNLAAVSSLCTRAVLLDRGRLQIDGAVSTVLTSYMDIVHATLEHALDEREDRQGSGVFRFTGIKVSSPAGPVSVGSPATVELAFRTTTPVRNALASFAVNGPFGEPLFLCSTRLKGTELATLPDEGVIRCDLASLPLLPGRYTMNVYGEGNGGVADWVEEAAAFDVVESDFFGTGQLPPDSHGRLVMEQAWTVEST